jgi:hypothetical protein
MLQDVHSGKKPGRPAKLCRPWSIGTAKWQRNNRGRPRFSTCPWRIDNSASIPSNSRVCYDKEMRSRHAFRPRNRYSCPTIAGQPADSGDDRNQDRPLHSLVPSLRGAADRNDKAGVSGSHVVLDERGSRKQAAGFQNLLQPLSHAYLTRGANARSGHEEAPTGRRSKLLQMATSLSRPLSHTDGCLIPQRLVLPAVSG